MVTAGSAILPMFPLPNRSFSSAAETGACGLRRHGRWARYAGLKLGTMQGNFGPGSKMDTALGAYTPNVPWAQIDCKTIVDMDGAGTSAATPQIAAAATYGSPGLLGCGQPVFRTLDARQAVRNALFKSALKSTGAMGPDDLSQDRTRRVEAAAALRSSHWRKRVAQAAAGRRRAWLNIDLRRWSQSRDRPARRGSARA
jgi:hypothetical protein